MAPRLALSKIQLIYDMLISREELTIAQITNTAECSRKAIYYIRSNLEQFSSARAPSIRPSPQRVITPLILEVLCNYLSEKLALYLDETAVFLLYKFNIHIAISSIDKTFTLISRLKRTARQKEKKA